MGSAKEEGTNRARTAIVKALDSPLLNDNKITGAKNVLLLIVSGTNEVTLDEIGEINDYIQDEAGYDANIIMGVGEDEKLGDAIAVTIVATGFAKDQQSTITNTEVKKIVHTLEDEQKATYNFNEKTVTKSSTIDEPISNSIQEKIIHILEDDTEVEEVKSAPKMDLIPTSEAIVNTPVFHEEVSLDVACDEDFIITDITPVIGDTIEEPKQIQADLLFDLPLNISREEEATTAIKFDLNDVVVNVNDLEVFGAEEVLLEHKAKENRYVLEDFDAKPTIGKSSRIVETETTVAEEEIQFELKTVTPKAEINNIETVSEEVSPLDLTISELQKRAEERRNKMKGFNYKFNDQLNKNIDEIERQPAYKRLGLDLSADAPISSSKTAIKADDSAIDFKSNNSFLHDNVD
jgi:cell division protein FtsZ